MRIDLNRESLGTLGMPLVVRDFCGYADAPSFLTGEEHPHSKS
ncbi:hypothetical protein [Microvirga tunisiensis]|nr:hypothetical protein [Microvirga tunisiensis]